MDMQGLPLDVEEVRPFYADADPIHDFDHVMRVTTLGWHLAKAEGADPEVVRTAALLHDVPVAGTARADHHVAAAEQASAFLAARGVSAATVEHVVDCIKEHRFRSRGSGRNSLEAKCLYDADKIDVLGAIGIVRTFAYAGLHGHSLWHCATFTASEQDLAEGTWPPTPALEWRTKLDRLVDSMHTASGRALAAQRHAVALRFCESLQAEYLQALSPNPLSPQGQE